MAHLPSNKKIYGTSYGTVENQRIPQMLEKIGEGEAFSALNLLIGSQLI
jgi:hypothetical protein